MRLACLVVACLPMLGQSSGVSSVAKAPGETVTLDISAESQPGKEPIALKWEVIFPAQLMEIEAAGPEIGKAAMDSGKSIKCTLRNPYTYVCVVSDGQKPIADGLIASFHFKIRTTAQARIVTLKIEAAESTTADSRKWPLNNTEAFVVIQ
jgi:hypothetical protein